MDLSHLAELVKLNFTKKEQEKLEQDVTQIIQFVEKLQEIETSHVTPLDQPIESHHHLLREDQVLPSLSKKEIFQNAPEMYSKKPEKNFFSVPNLFEKITKEE